MVSRNMLREKSYLKWSRYPQKGRAVILYRQVKSGWIYKKNGKSASEWRLNSLGRDQSPKMQIAINRQQAIEQWAIINRALAKRGSCRSTL